MKPNELSESQRQEFLAAKINLNKQPAKLVSDLKKNSFITDHVDNLLFLLVWYSAKIVRIKNCISFTTYPFLHDYCVDMAKHRAESPSKIQKQMTKLMTNSLAGTKKHFFRNKKNNKKYKKNPQ